MQNKCPVNFPEDFTKSSGHQASKFDYPLLHGKIAISLPVKL